MPDRAPYRWAKSWVLVTLEVGTVVGVVVATSERCCCESRKSCGRKQVPNRLAPG